MKYEISAMVNGERITEEYPSTSRQQAKNEFRLLYPAARRMVVIEVKQKRHNRMELGLEARAQRNKADPYYH